MNQKLKLLVVEDDADVREAIVDSLSLLEIDITSAENGELALTEFKKSSFHAVLSDINMPKMNGLELLKKIRETGSEIPFIVLTGFGDKANTVEALRFGAFDFLDKPFNTEDLDFVVLKALELGKVLSNLENEFSAKSSAIGAEAQKLFEAKKKLVIMKHLNSNTRKSAS